MDGLIRNPLGNPSSMRKAYGEALVELGRARQDVVVLSADVQSSDFSYMFEAAFPERFINVGIAEPALVDVAVGLANERQSSHREHLRFPLCDARIRDGADAPLLSAEPT